MPFEFLGTIFNPMNAQALVLKIGRFNHDLIPCLVHDLHALRGGVVEVGVYIPRPDILELHEIFLSAGNWGVERALNKWVYKQPWRKVFPLEFFEHPDLRKHGL